MAPTQSKFSANREALLKVQLQTNPPAIPFAAVTKRSKVKVGEGETNADQRVFSIPLDATSSSKTKLQECYKQYVAVFEEGTPEDWCALRTEAVDLFQAMGIAKDFEKQHNVWRSLFKGQAKDRFTALFNATKVEQEGVIDSMGLSYEQVLQTALNGVAKYVFVNWQKALRNQKQYMQHALSMGSMEPGKFCERLQKVNRYLAYFPSANPLAAPSPFEEEELLNIVGLSVPAEWSITMLTTNQGIETFETMEEVVVYFKQLHQADQLRKQLCNVATPPETKSRRNNNHNNTKRAGKPKEAPNSKRQLAMCPHCKKMGTHKAEDCRFNPSNAGKPEAAKPAYKAKAVQWKQPQAATANVNAMHSATITELVDGDEKDFEENLDEFLSKLRGK